MKVKKNTTPDIRQLSPGHFIFFEDKKIKEPLGEKTDCNQTGVLLRDNNVLFCRKNRMKQLPFKKIAPYAKQIVAYKDKNLLPSIAKYFDNNKKNHLLFKLGFHAIQSGKLEIIKSNIMPKFDSSRSEIEYENKWFSTISKAQAGDLIFTFNSKNLISQIISKLDKGSWSHVAMYCGNGKIRESISSGVVERDIDVYKNIHIHLGIYRIFGVTETDRKKALLRSKSLIGSKYNFKGALLLGLKTLLRMDIGKLVPTSNGLIYSGKLYLVDYL